MEEARFFKDQLVVVSYRVLLLVDSHHNDSS
jgi:hypothetical protein